jgi:hypothetical protein
MWKEKKGKDGKTYYYNVITRKMHPYLRGGGLTLSRVPVEPDILEVADYEEPEDYEDAFEEPEEDERELEEEPEDYEDAFEESEEQRVRDEQEIARALEEQRVRDEQEIARALEEQRVREEQEIARALEEQRAREEQEIERVLEEQRVREEREKRLQAIQKRIEKEEREKEVKRILELGSITQKNLMQQVISNNNGESFSNILVLFREAEKEEEAKNELEILELAGSFPERNLLRRVISKNQGRPFTSILQLFRQAEFDEREAEKEFERKRYEEAQQLGQVKYLETLPIKDRKKIIQLFQNLDQNERIRLLNTPGAFVAFVDSLMHDNK